MEKIFKLRENKTKVSTEVVAGLTTFFAMAYIIAVNPSILADAGMEWGAVFLATIISSVVGTLVMGLFANVPYAQAPGMGLNAFFVYTVCFGFGYTWQQALSMVFICGIINIIITVTRLRKHIIRAIPKPLQHAISGGIGIFIAYIGLINAGLIDISGAVPAMASLNTPALWLFLIGLFLVVILLTLKVKGAILISIVVTALIGIPMGVTQTQDAVSFADACRALPTTFGVIFTREGLGSLFTGGTSTVLTAIVTIFSFSITDTFDTIGTFIGTGRRSGIFSEKDEKAMDQSVGFKTKMDKALFADAIATSVGAIFGTSNTTTYVESAAGISAGGRTGLTSVVVALCFIVSAFFANLVSAIPYAATGPALVIVGIMMASSFVDVKWTDLDEAIPAFFAGAFMALA
ncbi:MAG: NCS2 family permease, partial [Oscillospiraceae bacterium]|nr:NCS2 family permease [Oscillospiraceae bacterium]